MISEDFNNLSFLDHTMVYMSYCDLNTLYIRANKAINNLYEWFCASNLALNASKAKYILVGIIPKTMKCTLAEFNASFAVRTLE